MADKTPTSRRGLLLGALALSGIAWGWQRFGVGPSELRFEEITGLPGWRRARVGDMSAPRGSSTSAVFVGLGEDTNRPEPLPADRLCPVLFRNRGGEVVPLAMFTDAFCPYCRVLSSRLIARADPVTWHELPLLGHASELAAKASAAADLQGGYLAFQSQLLTTPFRPAPAFVKSLAAAAGLNPERLVADMEGAEIARRLTESRAAASALGIYGTPGLVIGRTVTLGNASTGMLDRLITAERERPPACT